MSQNGNPCPYKLIKSQGKLPGYFPNLLKGRVSLKGALQLALHSFTLLPLCTAQRPPEKWRVPIDQGREDGVERPRVCKESIDELSLDQQICLREPSVEKGLTEL